MIEECDFKLDFGEDLSIQKHDLLHASFVSMKLGNCKLL